MLTHARAAAAAAIVLALAGHLGCTSGAAYPVPLEHSVAPQQRFLSEVFVTVDESEIPAERRTRFTEYGGAGLVRAAIVERLKRRHLWDPSARAVMRVRVVDCRLRSTSTSLWVGSTAGRDRLLIQADVEIEHQPARRFDATSSSIRGGIFFPGAGGRLDHLAHVVAKEVVAQLEE